ncbi:signal peptidase I [Patescibacteria group bacterium]|nr:signal peptidase I [Patescibacteria group bacterium]
MDQLGKRHPSKNEELEKEFIEKEIAPPFWKSVSSFVIEVLKIVIISLVIIVPIRYFLIKPFYVKGASMEPTFYDHEYLVIDEISYRFNDPARGDIVVFSYIEDPSQFFIKRIIGLPNEQIQIQNGEITIYQEEGGGGEIIDESAYLDEDVVTSGDIIVNLQNDEYFVLGDNRVYSLDSRRIGAVKKEAIVGRTWIRAWPFNKFTHFSTPEYGV